MEVRECFIPLPPEVERLNHLFCDAGFAFVVVGGRVRNHLMDSFSPQSTDFDLATDATPEQVASVLDGAGISNFGKGESFGVWVAHLNAQDFEIATFRQDIGASDGRHPDEVRYCTEEEDYRRRDLTINALYYHPPRDGGKGRIVDYGTGFQDIAERKIRVVGKPVDRFNEDKLRILRFVRFHCRYNRPPITAPSDIGEDTWNAIRRFCDLRAHGVSGPRIMDEFLKGLDQSLSVASYCESLRNLDLLPAVFGTDSVMLDKLVAFDRQGCRMAIPVLGTMFRCYEDRDVRRGLNYLNYSNEIADGASFLVKAYAALSLGDHEACVDVSLALDRHPLRRVHLDSFVRAVGIDGQHMVGYVPLRLDGFEVMREEGLSGKSLGEYIRNRRLEHYRQSRVETVALST